jgi:hypothetical protein
MILKQMCIWLVFIQFYVPHSLQHQLQSILDTLLAPIMITAKEIIKDKHRRLRAAAVGYTYVRQTCVFA